MGVKLPVPCVRQWGSVVNKGKGTGGVGKKISFLGEKGAGEVGVTRWGHCDLLSLNVELEAPACFSGGLLMGVEEAGGFEEQTTAGGGGQGEGAEDADFLGGGGQAKHLAGIAGAFFDHVDVEGLADWDLV